MQPFVLALIIWVSKGHLKHWSKVALAVYGVLVAAYSAKGWNTLKGTKEVAPGKGLFWEWNGMPGASPVYVAFLTALLTLVVENFTGYMRGAFSSIIVLSFGFSFFEKCGACK
jgi:hypothetical protein